MTSQGDWSAAATAMEPHYARRCGDNSNTGLSDHCPYSVLHLLSPIARHIRLHDPPAPVCVLGCADSPTACGIGALLLARARRLPACQGRAGRGRDERTLPLILPVLLCQGCCLNNRAVFLSAHLGTNICLRCKQALPGSAINRIIKQTVMSRITANYDKICFGICLRGSGVLKSAQEFITAPQPAST